MQLEPSARRQSIESLSVLLAHISILQEPDDGNYELFRRAANALQSAMDAILSPESEAFADNLPQLQPDTTSALPEWMISDHFGIGMDSWYVLSWVPSSIC